MMADKTFEMVADHDRYFIGWVSPKSHCDYPSSQFDARFIVKAGKDYGEVLKNEIKGCEDWNFWEVTRESYQNQFKNEFDDI